MNNFYGKYITETEQAEREKKTRKRDDSYRLQYIYSPNRFCEQNDAMQSLSSSLSFIVFAGYFYVIIKEKLDWITHREKDKTHHWEKFKNVLTTIYT